MGYAYIALTVVLTVYGQLVLKWQVGAHPNSTIETLDVLAVIRFLFNPWVFSAFAAAFVAALCWMAALSRISLSKAYPFTGLSFPLIALFAAVFFGERFDFPKMFGTALIISGVMVLSRSGS